MGRQKITKTNQTADQRRTQSFAHSALPSVTTAEHMLYLQRTIGNQAVLRLVQTKLKSNQPTDQYEQEADHIAEQITHSRASGSQLSHTGPMIQRQEKESAARTGTPSPGLIVEDDAEDVRPGQMRKSEFLSELKTSVCGAAEEALSGTIWSAMGCPYIERWFSHYVNQDGQHIERALRKYAPETAGVKTAREYIPIVTQRVRRGIKQWTETGEVTGVPEEFAQGGMPGVTAGGLLGGLVGGVLSAVGSAVSGLVSGVGKAVSGLGRMLFKGREGGARGEGEDPRAVQSQLGSGHSLDGGMKSKMESAFGMNFSDVRIHTDGKASELSDRLNARAFTIGRDIAFGPGEYQPGTPVGDALIAHELAHVVQQGGGSSSIAPLQKGGAEYSSLEEDADVSAVGAVASAWGGVKGALKDIGKNAMPRMRSGLRLQRCGPKYVTNVGVGVNTASGPPPAVPRRTEAEADAELSSLGLLSKVTKLAPPSNRYDCHGFTFLGGDSWINDDQVDAILGGNGYSVTTTPVVGDIVIYRNGGAIKHSGIITAVSGNAVTQIESKWGRLGLYRHAPGDVPANYGTWKTYHTARPGGHRLRRKP